MFIAAAETGGLTVELLLAWGITVVALGLSVVARWWLSRGVGAGLFIASLSGLLLLYYVSLGESGGGLLQCGTCFAGLSILWFAVAVWVERDKDEPVHADYRAIRRGMGLHASAVAGLLVAASVLTVVPLRHLTAVPVLLAVLLGAVSVAAYVWRRSVMSRYAGVAVVVLLLWVLTQPGEAGQNEVWRSLALLVVGAVALMAVIWRLLADWRVRVRVWEEEPRRLIEPPPTHRRLYALVVAGCVLVGVGAVWVPAQPLTPLAVLLAGYACLTAGHRRRSNAVGEIGLALVGGAVVTAANAWLPASQASGLLGWALGSLLLLWLARFWHQQLDDGRPWTTAGRLIPAARNLAYAMVGGELVMAAAWVMRGDGSAASPVWMSIATAVVVLLQWLLLIRDATEQRSSAGALVACVALMVALVPVRAVLAHYGLSATPAVLFAGAGLVLALRTGRIRGPVETDWPYNAYLGGLLPLAALYDLALRGRWADQWPMTVGVVVCLVLTIVLRWRSGLRPAGR